ncbi:MAG: hypothetical protein ABID84_04700 [Chloroflexota bacterium]
MKDKEVNISYRVWVVVNPPAEATFYDVATPEEGARLIEKLTREHLKDPSIVANVFGLEVMEGGEWHEWYDEEGRGIDHYRGTDYSCAVCGHLMEEEPDYEFSGTREGNIALFCEGCVETCSAFEYLRERMVPPHL